MTEIDLTPDEAVDGFLEEKREEVSQSTWRNYRYPLNFLIEFCDDEQIEYVGDLSGYDLKRFKTRRRQDDINNVTLYNNLSVIRVFLQWCEEAEAVEREFHELVNMPELDDGEIAADDYPELGYVEDILDYLYRFEYAKRKHAVFQLIWHTCIRMGTVMALDVDDFYPRSQQIEVAHRPNSGTPLKNGSKAERIININDEMVEVLADYIEVHREDIVEDSGREPLFTTPTQRLHDPLLRKDMYALTRPCHVGLDCPHDRDPETCEATYKKKASKCPSSLSPHPLRRAAITYHLNREWPKEKLSERANVSVDILDKHYDARTKGEAAATRRQYLDHL